jgi:hypothetical protein
MHPAHEGEALCRLVQVEAMLALGDDEAGATLASARAWLMARAEKIHEPALRERFLEDVPEHARLLELSAR